MGRLLSCVLLTCLLLCLSAGIAGGPDRDLPAGVPPGFRRWLDAPIGEGAIVWRQLRVNLHGADTSLNVREQEDFLLTPALLVQEAVSPGVVLTYPEE